MVRIALAVVAAVGLTVAADAAAPQIGPLCQTPTGDLVVRHTWHGGPSQIGPSARPPMAIWLSVAAAERRRLVPSVRPPRAI